ncbi:MAG: Radical SAM domain protein [Candidatus Magasanikbacteria bacterium GW2011_GWC2_40_17]|uniref:Radical SAM domain protein n=1 Tax=Candidatus Magasanikbacteria bacterium GW2011_GWA2_42_32 TaxID=1619039 RepID=A0A0G1CX23_9BACT|nr:MAG: Radical SAM domain protein [Candidatus Magasanikbacteria bacterium GW2011_GWC2_40_17]KKS54183.1 MAG: Radical SAM domain protein [Candidatus Magasanikbacteria bacterium GW2011_GWA2_42_32]HBX16165.1 hypothetical protein [Candidatus Magasanikbacteria bacterium]
MKPDIPQVRQTPDPQLDNILQHWGFFTKTEIVEATAKGQLLMLDLDFGDKCSLHCAGCFRRKHVAENGLANSDPNMTYDEIIDVISQAQALGLRTVKLCGKGEPFENTELLRFAHELTARGIGLAIFTKGHVIGDDVLVAETFGHEGITDGEMLCRELVKLKVSIMPSVPSFNDQLLGKLVGRRPEWYAPRLKLAVERLAKAGFNKTRPTRLALVHAPLTRVSIDGAFAVYHFARERNIIPVLAAHMVSGKQITDEFLLKADASDEKKHRLFQQVLAYNIKQGYQTHEQILLDGPSCMPGIHPCNQIAVGLYVMIKGTVMRCPGDFAKSLGNIRDEPLADIWERNRWWKWTGVHNVGCPYKDGHTLPLGLYDELKQEV